MPAEIRIRKDTGSQPSKGTQPADAKRSCARINSARKKRAEGRGDCTAVRAPLLIRPLKIRVVIRHVDIAYKKHLLRNPPEIRSSLVVLLFEIGKRRGSRCPISIRNIHVCYYRGRGNADRNANFYAFAKMQRAGVAPATFFAQKEKGANLN